MRWSDGVMILRGRDRTYLRVGDEEGILRNEMEVEVVVWIKASVWQVLR